MASRPSGRMYSRDEVLNEIFAVPVSDLDENNSEEEYEEESSPEEDSSGEDNIEAIESDVLDTASDNNQLQPRGIDHDRGQPARRANRREARGRGGVARQNRQQVEAVLELQWTSNDHEPTIPSFTANAGIQVQLPNEATVGDFLRLFLTNDFFDMLVTQTNMYAAQSRRNNSNLSANARANLWVETTRDEIKKFIALSLLMGIVKKPELSDYWSTNPLLKGSIFNSVMPRNRFQSIL